MCSGPLPEDLFSGLGEVTSTVQPSNDPFQPPAAAAYPFAPVAADSSPAAAAGKNYRSSSSGASGEWPSFSLLDDSSTRLN